PPSARYGFAVASLVFSSKRCGTDLAPKTRTAASRLSMPQAANAPAQKCGLMRRYEEFVGTVSAQRAGRCATIPAMNDPARALRPVALEASPGTFLPSRHRLRFRWQPLPALSSKTFGRTEATSPCLAATPWTVSLKTTWESAAASASVNRVDSSC